MSFKDCVDGKIKAGVVDKDRGKEMLDFFDELDADARARMSPEEAARFAAIETVEATKRFNAHKRRQQALMAKVQQRIGFDLNKYRGSNGEGNIVKAAEALFSPDDFATYGNVMSFYKEWRGIAHGEMTDVLKTFRKTVTGATREPARLKNLVKELFGENTGDASARELAGAWGAASERMRKKFNELGGSIGKLEKWGMSQYHDGFKIADVSKEEWIDFIRPRLDRAKILDNMTNKSMSAERLELVLGDIYETLKTGGANKMTPSGRTIGQAVANRRNDPRFLVFRDADSWLEYQDAFGRSDPFDAMMIHIDSMARDIALMEVLGPNPAAMKNWLEQTLVKDAQTAKGDAKTIKGKISRALGGVRLIDNMYRTHTGELTAPVNSQVANVLGGTRNVLVAAQLGSAFISALSDVAYSNITARFNGLPAVKVLQRQLKLMNPKNEADRALAVRLGLVADLWSNAFFVQARMTGDVVYSDIGARLSNGVLRASLLSAWTQAGKHAFGMEFLSTLGENVGKTFGELDKPLRDSMRKSGITEARWAKIRQVQLRSEQGAKYMDAELIRQMPGLATGEGDALAGSVLNMVNRETQFAVPEQTLRSRAQLLQGTRPGTIVGEILRSGIMYKAFSVTVFATHVMRGFNQQSTKQKGKYLGEMVLASTLMGMFALQLKQIKNGKDPRPFDVSLVAASLIQGGGLGIFGDFIYSSENRFGGGLAETIGGPVVGLVQDTVSLTAGNAFEAIRGEETNFGRDITDYVRRYTPGQSLWYADVAAERLIFDNLQKALDPKAAKSFRRKEKSLQKQYGQGYYWPPGHMAPERLPDLTNIVEGN